MIAAPTTAPESSATFEHCVPTAALAIDGTQPEVGDPVDYAVTGRVTRIEGAHAYVTPELINDQPAQAEAEAEPDDMDSDDMLAMAAKADAEG